MGKTHKKPKIFIIMLLIKLLIIYNEKNIELISENGWLSQLSFTNNKKQNGGHKFYNSNIKFVKFQNRKKF